MPSDWLYSSGYNLGIKIVCDEKAGCLRGDNRIPGARVVEVAAKYCIR